MEEDKGDKGPKVGQRYQADLACARTTAQKTFSK